MKKNIYLVHCAAMIVFFLTVCGGGCIAAPMKKMNDVDGHIIEVPTNAKRVVVLNSNALEALLILDATNVVAGVFSDVGKYDWLYPHVKQIPLVGRWSAPNMEVISKLNPDVIITYRKNPSDMLEKQASLFGICVVRLDLHNLETFDAELKILATMLGKEKEANRFLRWKKNINKQGDRILQGTKKRPTIYVENFVPYKSLGRGSAGFEMMRKIGARSITNEFKTPYPFVGDEWILAKNPDVIVKVPGGAPAGKSLQVIRHQMEERPLWGDLQAVKKGRLGVLHTTLFSGPRGVIGRLYLIKWCHPEKSKGLDVERIHKEYYQLFLREPYGGVWIISPGGGK